jgi:hypothetical protein
MKADFTQSNSFLQGFLARLEMVQTNLGHDKITVWNKNDVNTKNYPVFSTMEISILESAGKN